MAASRDPDQLTRRQIVRLASAISADAMESIAEGYMNLSSETLKNLWRENQGKAEAFSREIIRHWIYKNPDDQVKVSELFQCSCSCGKLSKQGFVRSFSSQENDGEFKNVTRKLREISENVYRKYKWLVNIGENSNISIILMHFSLI